jgi:Flp pilus assembly protein TadD
MTTDNMQTRGRYRSIHKGRPQMKPLFIAIILVLGLMFTQASVYADLPDAKTENLNLVAGRQAIKAKDFRSAVKTLTKAVEENPKDADAHTMLGYSYRKLGAFDKSLEHYQIALKINVNHRSAHEYLGELYLDMNQPANAEKQLQALRTTCPLIGKCAEYDDLKVAIEKHKSK